tara:strand:+ start:1963 stop:2382 length:420 start_codon:yes stop_codon:yes gene_type:complete
MRILLVAMISVSLVLFPVVGLADEPPEVVQFEDMPAEYTKDGQTYVGILVSEAEYEKMLLAVKDRDIQIDFWTSKYTSLEVLHNRSLEINTEHIRQLESIIQKNNTWFDRNKGGIGFALGVLVASATTIGLTYAVNQPR